MALSPSARSVSTAFRGSLPIAGPASSASLRGPADSLGVAAEDGARRTMKIRRAAQSSTTGCCSSCTGRAYSDSPGSEAPSSRLPVCGASLMRAEGFEPPRAEAHQDLNLARMPIPPRPRGAPDRGLTRGKCRVVASRFYDRRRERGRGKAGVRALAPKSGESRVGHDQVRDRLPAARDGGAGGHRRDHRLLADVRRQRHGDRLP